MSLTCGIVGLPNVGKSTLFNALSDDASAEVANYPFCTIEPNVAEVGVPDPKLDKLAAIDRSAKTIPYRLSFVDIAGLVKGASAGAGLGNKFLSHVREVDAILHVVRCFDDESVTHVEESVDPVRDVEIIDTEIILADLESLERRRIAVEKRVRSGAKEDRDLLRVMDMALGALAEGKPARSLAVSSEDQELLRQLSLISAKPVLYVANYDENSLENGNAFTRELAQYLEASGEKLAFVCSKIEAELRGLNDADRKEFLEDLGLKNSALDSIVLSSFELLDLLTFFTVGPKEARAWAVKNEATAPQAAGKIHSDFERGFICAETVSYDDYVRYSGRTGAANAGALRQEGRDYIVRPDDVFLFRFNV